MCSGGSDVNKECSAAWLAAGVHSNQADLVAVIRLPDAHSYPALSRQPCRHCYGNTGCCNTESLSLSLSLFLCHTHTHTISLSLPVLLSQGISWSPSVPTGRYWSLLVSTGLFSSNLVSLLVHSRLCWSLLVFLLVAASPPLCLSWSHLVSPCLYESLLLSAGL